MLTLFVMLTLENFPVYMDRGMEVYPWSWIYFVSFVLIAAFIVINVLIGIVLNSLEEAREIERRRRIGVGVEETDFAPAPVMERMQMLRAALDELEQELAAGHRGRKPDAGEPGRTHEPRLASTCRCSSRTSTGRQSRCGYSCRAAVRRSRMRGT